MRLTSLCKRWMALRIQWPDGCERLGLLFLPQPGLGSGFFDGELIWQFLAFGAEPKPLAHSYRMIVLGTGSVSFHLLSKWGGNCRQSVVSCGLTQHHRDTTVEIKFETSASFQLDSIIIHPFSAQFRPYHSQFHGCISRSTES